MLVFIGRPGMLYYKYTLKHETKSLFTACLWENVYWNYVCWPIIVIYYKTCIISHSSCIKCLCFIGFFLFIYYMKTSSLFGDSVPKEDSDITEDTNTENPYDNEIPTPAKKISWMSLYLCIWDVISVYRYLSFICSIIVNSMQISSATYVAISDFWIFKSLNWIADGTGS